MLESALTHQTRSEASTSQKLQELKEDNERLRKTLAVLHLHSLRLRDQRDILLEQRDGLLDACTEIVRRVQNGQLVDNASSSSREQFNDALSDRANGRHSKSGSIALDDPDTRDDPQLTSTGCSCPGDPISEGTTADNRL